MQLPNNVQLSSDGLDLSLTRDNKGGRSHERLPFHFRRQSGTSVGVTSVGATSVSHNP